MKYINCTCLDHLLFASSYLYRAEKDKQKFQQEIFELMSQVESINKEKVKNEYTLDFAIRKSNQNLEL